MIKAEVFKALGDPVRLRLFYLLAIGDELCVCHLTAALGLPQSTVSRHLGILRNAGLVTTRREGKWMHYRLAGDAARALSSLVKEEPDAFLRADARRLTAILEGRSA